MSQIKDALKIMEMLKEFNKGSSLMKTKTCPRCEEEKSLSEFYTKNDKYVKKDGTVSVYVRVQERCKECNANVCKEYVASKKM